ncbi:hypothetical protein JRG49_16625 [Pseudomonas fulva]|uniref:hypothetical protein n=1 Tax=Pseudomonas TaxID=286 RepID=UPI0019D1C905|nr:MULTISPECIES: hypothetical protein [Pseudomonas]MBN6791341.1 hypothetical protein [Pseudomonas fulva]MBN6794369.1 hypothetical protein [Pseudomonas fulva]MBN6857056.1 hypothetical protein [Pseudomonas fulva]MBN6873184.1 hypothetical protein [Pseudomonas fulva]MBN6878408.1 hypothetical protein [Pseudomonas fulva]
MLNYSYDRSFIAQVRCLSLDAPGYLDCAKLVERGQQAARAADDWMIVTSLVTKSPHMFMFRCLFDAAIGRPYYDIQSWSRKTGRDFQSANCHLDCSNNGYAGLYAAPPGEQTLWKFMQMDKGGEWRSMTSIVEPGQTIRGRIHTRSNIPLQAYRKETVAGHWFAYVVNEGGQPMDLELDILHVGQELMDDH